jgi:hypothetical protein
MRDYRTFEAMGGMGRKEVEVVDEGGVIGDYER